MLDPGGHVLILTVCFTGAPRIRRSQSKRLGEVTNCWVNTTTDPDGAYTIVAIATDSEDRASYRWFSFVTNTD